MSLLLVTAANRGYMERITPYLATIAEHGGAFDRRILISVGCQVAMPDGSPIEAVALPASEARGHTGNFCIQQGCFLDVLGAADDDVIVFTDGDIRMQRDPYPDEIAWLRAIPRDTIALAWNCGAHDTLGNEADRIGLDAAGRDMFADVMGAPVYNVGVIVTRAATYRSIYAAYMDLWDAFAPHTEHYARNQFLMCAIIHRYGLLVWDMPPTVHAHDHCGFPAWAWDRDGTMMIQDTPVLFRHHWNC